MGILDSLENSPELKSMLGQLGAAVIPAVLGEVMGNGGQGGLSAIVAKLEQAGLGDQVKSWIGTGQNLPITAEQLQQVPGAQVRRAQDRIRIGDVRSVICELLLLGGALVAVSIRMGLRLRWCIDHAAQTV